MTNKHIGTITETGVEWPELTLSGKPYDKPPTQYRMIGNGQLVVLDTFPAVDQYGAATFDVEAAISKLLGTGLKPEDAAKVAADARFAPTPVKPKE